MGPHPPMALDRGNFSLPSPLLLTVSPPQELVDKYIMGSPTLMSGILGTRDHRNLLSKIPSRAGIWTKLSNYLWLVGVANAALVHPFLSFSLYISQIKGMMGKGRDI